MAQFSNATVRRSRSLSELGATPKPELFADYLYGHDAHEHKKKSKQLSRSSSKNSLKSCGSSASRSSSHLSSLAVMHAASVAEAKVRLKYATREAELTRQEAAIRAELSVLKVREEVDSAQSKLDLVQQALQTDCVKPYQNPTCNQGSGNHYGNQALPEQNNSKITQNDASYDHFTQTEFARLIIKKDILPSRLTKFDDNPMSYIAWKLSFRGICKEYRLNSREELDLLVQWLGPDSSAQAKNIRDRNAHDPALAVQKIWIQLDKRIGAPENIERSLKSRVLNFPLISKNEPKKLYELSDLVGEIEAVKCQPQYKTLFGYYDSCTGVDDIVLKLPVGIREKWISEATKYKRSTGELYPPFTFFAKFLRDMADMKNDPSFQFGASNELKTKSLQPLRDSYKPSRTGRLQVTSRRTEVSNSEPNSVNSSEKCPVHTNMTHSLNDCYDFRRRSLQDRLKFIQEHGLCFKCCSNKRHWAKNCKLQKVSCNICKNPESNHPTAMHDFDATAPASHKPSHSKHVHADVNTQNKTNPKVDCNVNPTKPKSKVNSVEVSSSCTQVCGSKGVGKSCAKILQVKVFPKSQPANSRNMYVLIDDQSTHSLAAPSFFDSFGEKGPRFEYILVSCGGKRFSSGRRADGYVIESLDSSTTLKLPTLIECSNIPNNKDEIPSPEVCNSFPHLQKLANDIPPIEEHLDIEILIGRDLIVAHQVLDQIVGIEQQPMAQKLPLGWVLLGEVCIDQIHIKDTVNVNFTNILHNGRPSYFQPCENALSIDPFVKTPDDEKVGLSVEDKTFLKIMDTEFEQNSSGQWTAPLPFREGRPSLPNNKCQAEKRAKSLNTSLRSNPKKCDHVRDFMQKVFDRNHAEVAPAIPPDRERWYLPMFGIYHPKKPDSIRVVFDSSAKHHGISLNDVLLKGPDLLNTLQGVLLRFRREKVALTVDVEQMFHNFKVKEAHRDFLRFLWHPDHDLDQPLKEFRMTVHVFGNCPSPAVATYGLRRTVQNADKDVRDFVTRNFYVDDGLISCSSVEEAVDLLQRTQKCLKEEGQLRLHKLASNSKSVLLQFPPDDLAKDLKNLDIGYDTLPVQRSLGMTWDIESDTFIFCVSTERKPLTRRGVLSTINSLFDPIGFTSPVILQGKLLLRELTSSGHIDWDEPLDDSFRQRWDAWLKSLTCLEDLNIPRMYCKYSVSNSSRVEVHIFSDASKDSIAAVAFLKVFQDEDVDVSFLLGKGKVAPLHGHTIPRLELCAAVLSIDLAETISEQMDIDRDMFYFYSDSQVVLGYISNDARRFYIYVGNRVSRIRAFAGPEKWNFVPTDRNPADVATRKLDARNFPESPWIRGPDFLRDIALTATSEVFPLLDVNSDNEIKQEVCISKTEVVSCLGTPNFSRVSTWKGLVRAVTKIQQLARKYHKTKEDETLLPQSAETYIIRQVQREIYSSEIEAITEGRKPPPDSSLLSLNPILDSNGILRIGGRISKTQAFAKNPSSYEPTVHPVIIPKGHHIAILLVRHFHESTHHQGRHLTEGAVRAAGYWLVGCKRLISSLLRRCVTCRKLRGQFGWIKMADLPVDRLQPCPAFTYVGVDTFGPWPVVTRRTRGGVSNSNRWAILFSCLVSRAVHIELVEELSTASFINALRRFTAIRGPVRQFRSDRGTNFVGAVKELNIDAHFVESDSMRNYLAESDTSWIFNPPHASHFGGVWERIIGSCRKILDAMLLEHKAHLTHEILSTFMMEICAILNSRPLVPVTTDSQSPEILSPSLLLTQKPSAVEHQLPLFGSKDAIRSQWKRVQHMADRFWSRWRREYLHNLQHRQKWPSGGIVFSAGDLVLMKDDDLPRYRWPMAIVDETYPSDDDNVRKVKVSVSRDGKRISYIRPINQLILLLEVQ